MNDMSQVIIPRSDQKNADDFLAGPLTITITKVTIRGGQEQPIAMSFEGDEGKPYKPCKSMCRIMVAAWGADASKYVGRSLTLYRDPTVKWAGMEVGGIRISHMSDIATPMTMALTVTRANKKPFTVRPLEAQAPKAAAPKVSQDKVGPADTTEQNPAQPSDAAAPTITADEALTLEARCTDNSINVAALKKAAGVERLSLIKPDDLPRAHMWVDKAIEKRKGTP